MYQKEATVVSQVGLHARPASLLVKMCLNYKAKLKIQFEEKTIDPRSILSVMGASLSQGSVITIIGDGEDEEAAVNDIADFINTFVE